MRGFPRTRITKRSWFLSASSFLPFFLPSFLLTETHHKHSAAQRVLCVSRVPTYVHSRFSKTVVQLSPSVTCPQHALSFVCCVPSHRSPYVDAEISHGACCFFSVGVSGGLLVKPLEVPQRYARVDLRGVCGSWTLGRNARLAYVGEVTTGYGVVCLCSLFPFLFLLSYRFHLSSPCQSPRAARNSWRGFRGPVAKFVFVLFQLRAFWYIPAYEEVDQTVFWAFVKGKLCSRSPGLDGGYSTRKHEHGCYGAGERITFSKGETSTLVDSSILA